MKKIGMLLIVLSSGLLYAQGIIDSEAVLNEHRNNLKKEQKKQIKEESKKIKEDIKEHKKNGKFDTKKFLNVGVPLIDQNSGIASAIITGAYGIALVAEKNVQKRVDNFTNVYRERAIHHGGILVMTKILNRLEEAQARYIVLQQENQRLSFLYYSKKKDNEASLQVVQQSIEQLIIELRNNTASVSVILGDRINLYHSMQRTLKGIHKYMDIIEENINRSRILRKLITK